MKKFKILSLFFVMILINSSISFALILPKNINEFDKLFNLQKIKQFVNDMSYELNGFIPSNVKKNDLVTFGRFYDIDENNQLVVKPITWFVIDKKDNEVLLLSQHILRNLKYNNTWEKVSWEESSARKWLNEDFYNFAFTDLEKNFIVEKELINHKNEKYDVDAGNNTIDKVFLLSINEVSDCRLSTKVLKTKGTKYAITEGLWISKVKTSLNYSVWWLRTPGEFNTFASLMYAGGGIGERGDGVATLGNGIRPSIWVRIR